MPRARHEKQASSSSLITHFVRRCWQLSQGQAGNPADGDPMPSGVSKPLLLKLAEKASGCALPWRLDANLEVFGAMAMGADLEMALGIDILKGWKTGKATRTIRRQISSRVPAGYFDFSSAAGTKCVGQLPSRARLWGGNWFVPGTSYLARRDFAAQIDIAR